MLSINLLKKEMQRLQVWRISAEYKEKADRGEWYDL